jgi:hypothetical protein
MAEDKPTAKVCARCKKAIPRGAISFGCRACKETSPSFCSETCLNIHRTNDHGIRPIDFSSGGRGAKD